MADVSAGPAGGDAVVPGGAGVAGAELADLDPFALLDAECARLDRHFSALGEEGWRRPSRCAGWTTRDVLSHVLGIERYSEACLDDDLAGLMAEGAAAGVADVHGWNEWWVRSHADRPAGDVLEEWRRRNAAVRDRLRERGRGGTMTTFVGPYPVGLQCFHVASEYATHADDVGADVAEGEAAARVEWRARFTRFAVPEAGREVRLDAEPDGAAGVTRVQAAGKQVVLDDGDLVEAAMGRLPEDHPLPPAVREVLAIT